MASLIVGSLYVFLVLELTGNVAAAMGAVVFTAVACVPIWYAKQVSMITVHRGMYWLKPIPPIYIRWVGWLILLSPLAVIIGGILTQVLKLPTW